jgi:fluoride ion exporter CrcB/FEX
VGALPPPTEKLRISDRTGSREVSKYLIVGIGGFARAIARLWWGAFVGQRMGTRFPYGTFINRSGSFLIGVM